nr:DMT family transporter [Halomonas socia]
MSIAIAFIATLFLGLTHFINGIISEHYSPVRVAFYTHLGGGLVGLICAIFLSTFDAIALYWGAAAGVGSALGAFFLYRGLSTSPFSTVVPVSAVSMVCIALGLSLLISGERVNFWIWIGLLFALPGIWLTAGGKSLSSISYQAGAGSGLLHGLAAGAGFALQLYLLGRIPESAVFFGIATCMICGAFFLSPYHNNKITSSSYHYPTYAIFAGGISAIGLTLYIISQKGQLAIVSIIIVSLYPLVPVIFGSIARNEVVNSYRIIGITLSIAATMLIVVGGNV